MTRVWSFRQNLSKNLLGLKYGEQRKRLWIFLYGHCFLVSSASQPFQNVQFQRSDSHHRLPERGTHQLSPKADSKKGNIFSSLIYVPALIVQGEYWLPLLSEVSPCWAFGSPCWVWLPLLSEDAMRIQEDGPRRMVKDERSVNVVYEWMLKNNKFQKEWHSATKPLKSIAQKYRTVSNI